MDRRAFLTRTGLTALGASALANVPIGANAVTFYPVARTVRVLAEGPNNPEQHFFKGLSDDIFERLRSAFRTAWPHRSMRIVDRQQIGQSAEEGYLDHQWNTSYVMRTTLASDTPPFFHLAHFRDSTNGWIHGTAICPGRDAFGWETPSRGVEVPLQAMFPPEIRVVGLPWVPFGVVWRALYVDKDTGLVMRALSVIDITIDDYVLRCDLICG